MPEGSLLDTWDWIDGGDLRRKAQIIQEQRVSDGAGGWVDTPIVVCTPWIGIKPLSGRELEVAQQINSRLTVGIRLRYRAGITPQMRVQFIDPGTGVSHSFLIHHIIDVAFRHRELQAFCEEYQAGAP